MESHSDTAVVHQAPDAALDDDQVLDFTQQHRRGVIKAFTKNGTEYPTDPKDAKVLLTALSDMDRTVLTKKRIATDEKIAAQSAEQIDMISRQLLGQLHGSGTLPPVIEGEASRVVEFDDSKMPPLEIGDGEMTVGIQTETFDDFRKRYEEKYGKPKRRED